MNVAWKARPSLQQVWAHLLQASGCLWWAKRQLRRRGAVMVLTFHRVLNDREFQRTCSLPGIVIRRRTFEKLAGYVAGQYTAVDFAEAIAAPASKMRVMFTLDDGWRDTYTNALPVMRARGIPATVFVCPGLVGRTLPFWPELIAWLLGRASPRVGRMEVESIIETLKTYTPERRQKHVASLYRQHAPASGMANGEDAYDGDRTVSWDEIREMDAAGASFGCHTHTHQILTTVPEQAARQEICKSKGAIEAALRRRCDLFAYPNGNSSAATRQILADEGFAAAFTTERGAWTGESDRMAIPRVNVCEASVVGLTGRFSPAMFQYSVFWKAWRAMRAERRPTAKP
ncbi:MAG TPA: polysaccharide deacetylase family protein, partial [Bryobacteraceae bacterium]|nr:polysaccharide deacetylase family protein [Bryobacteraceae bacterium]